MMRSLGSVARRGMALALVCGRALVAQSASVDTVTRHLLCVSDAATGAPVTQPIVEEALPNGRWR
ncbi:MAG: hypothetical protein MUD17_01720, partial [Gemmatimonadaceae bacterium]|nr:hypothetical protein [Gemmatimonadaceae bacterium]